MNLFVTFLLRILSSKIAQELAVQALEAAVKHSDNTVDDAVVAVVKRGLAGRADPLRQAVRK